MAGPSPAAQRLSLGKPLLLEAVLRPSVVLHVVRHCQAQRCTVRSGAAAANYGGGSGGSREKRRKKMKKAKLYLFGAEMLQ